MRLKFTKLLSVFIIFLNLVIFYYSWRYFLASNQEQQSNDISKVQPKTTQKPKDKIQSANKHLKKSITIVFREFLHFENDLKQSIDNVLNVIQNIKILIIYDFYPYPPIDIFNGNNNANSITSNQSSVPALSLIYGDNVKFISLGLDLTKEHESPLDYIMTRYVLFLPDSIRSANFRQMLQRILKKFAQADKQEKGLMVIPFLSNKRLVNYCFQINVDLPNWTIEYLVRNGTNNCDMFTQKHGLLVESATLRTLSEPLASPFPEYFYLQFRMLRQNHNQDYTIQYANETLVDGKKLLTSHHNKQKRKSLKKDQFKALYKKLQIKKVVKKFYYMPPKESSLPNKKGGKESNKDKPKSGKNAKENKEQTDVLIEPLDFPATVLTNLSLPSLKTETCYYGCEKNTKSCIGQIYNNRPFYYYLNKNTPPCCLEKLKVVFQYLVEELENTGIRYWLDNYALKNAIELNGVLSKDAFEIDLSFNYQDFNRSNALKRCSSRPYTEMSSGFYFMKATDGNYFKVQYSKTNQVAVNLLPFKLESDGNKMKPHGFFGWKAKEFSVEYLHPQSTVYFLGKNVFCPNNVREYLDMKYNKS